MKKNYYLDIEDHKYLNFGEQPDLFYLQLGYELVSLVDEKKGAPLLDKITKYRKQFDEEYGLFLPPIRIVDNMSLKPSEYAILFNGIEVGRGDIPKGYCYCLDTGKVKTPLNCDFWIKTKKSASELTDFSIKKEAAYGTPVDVPDPSMVICMAVVFVCCCKDTKFFGWHG